MEHGRWPLCNRNAEYNVAHIYHDWSLCLYVINIESKKSATSSVLFCFFVLFFYFWCIHYLEEGLKLWWKPLLISFHDFPEDHLHLLRREIIEDRNYEHKNFGFNGLNWDSESHVKLNFPGRTNLTINSSAKCRFPSFKQLNFFKSSFPGSPSIYLLVGRSWLSQQLKETGCRGKFWHAFWVICHMAAYWLFIPPAGSFKFAE